MEFTNEELEFLLDCISKDFDAICEASYGYMSDQDYIFVAKRVLMEKKLVKKLEKMLEAD